MLCIVQVVPNWEEITSGWPNLPTGFIGGNHKCIAVTRPDSWDSARVGAGGAPVKTPEGWLEIYHGANDDHRYCLGALLLDLNDPSKVLARSVEPIMEPVAGYEKKRIFGNVVFTNGHYVEMILLNILRCE